MLEVTSVLILFGLSLALITFRTIHRAYFTTLSDIPGPWLAKFTRFWLAKAIYSRNYHKINAELHEKWGPVVRIAPNEYSIDDADAAQIIYRSRDQLDKSVIQAHQTVVIPLAALSSSTQTHSCKTCSRGSIYPLTKVGDPISNLAHIN